MAKNQAAVALGKLAKGVPKNFTMAERKRRSKRMTKLNRMRALNGFVKGNSHDRRKARRTAKCSE